MVCPVFSPNNSDIVTPEVGRIYLDTLKVTCNTGYYIYQGQVGLEDSQYVALCDETGNWNSTLDCESKSTVKAITIVEQTKFHQHFIYIYIYISKTL